MEETGYIEGRKFIWTDCNPCIVCSREMHKKGKPEDGKVSYHAKGYCSPCYQSKSSEHPKRVYMIFDEYGQTCTKCLEHLPYSNFSTHSKTRSKYNPWCNVCRKLYKFNITKPQYQKLLEDHDHKCAICFQTPSEGDRALAIDHDHSCCPGTESCGNCIRGLLCSNCNKGLGCLGDTVEALESAYNYLKERSIVQSNN